MSMLSLWTYWKPTTVRCVSPSSNLLRNQGRISRYVRSFLGLKRCRVAIGNNHVQLFTACRWNRTLCGHALYNSVKRTKIMVESTQWTILRSKMFWKTVIYRTLINTTMGGSGRPTKIMNKKTLRSLRTMFTNKNSMSQQEAASKFNCSKSYIGETLEKEGTHREQYAKINSDFQSTRTN